MDQGTAIRTIVLAVALINQFLVSAGLYAIPGTAEQQTELLSAVFVSVAATLSWFKNNYITAKGKRQKQLIEKAGAK